jgi:secretory carrier-associated membrane protein
MNSSVVTEDMVVAKEQQNAARLKEINKRKSSVAHAVEPEPNFPPECCCVKPLIYHNIREQVPVTQQRFMYILAGCYVSLMILIIYNIVCAIISFVFGGSAMGFGLSFLYLLGFPGAWMLWYYNVYCATVYLSRPQQVLALLGLFLAVCFDAWMAIGVTNFGGMGFIYAFAMVGHLPSFIVLLICAILWCCHGALMGFMFVRYWAASAALLRKSANIYAQAII